MGEREILFIEYPKCSTCQKAKKWLDGHNITYTDCRLRNFSIQAVSCIKI